MKCVFLIILFIVGYGAIVNGQTIIRGEVKDEKGAVVDNVYITVTQKGSSGILAYVSTNAEGNYTLTYRGNADTICINVSRLDFRKESTCVPNKSQRLDFTLKVEITQLKEIVIKPSKVRHNRDTVNYSVREFTNKDDRSIADVLKRLPGIEISASGRISYNGEPINKFYVENMDLMGGQYNIISNNLNNKHVETVQVLENHEPLKALQNNSMSDKAALNLVLKDDAKAKWLASGKFGIGIEPLLWDNDLTLMRFGKASQSIFIYKNNNTGNDISSDLISHYGLLSKSSKNNLLAIPTSTPPISQTNRYLFNNAHLFTVNNLWKLNKDYQLRLNADYLNDYQKRNTSTHITHYLNGEEIEINEDSKTAININKAKASLTLTGNHPNYYLVNNLSAQADWSNENATISQSKQYLKNPYYTISNNLNYLKLFGRSRLEILSNNRYESMPQLLEIKPGLYEDIFNNGNPYDMLKQKGTLKNFKSDNAVTYSHTKGKWGQNYSAGYKLTNQNLYSELLTKPSTASNPDFMNNSTFTENRYYTSAKYDYTGKQIRASLTLPVGYFTLNANDKTRGEKKTDQGFYFNPSLYFKYDFNVLWSSTISASYNDYYSDIRSYYMGYMLSNYRSIAKNSGDFNRTESQNYNLTISYRDPIKLTNIYLTTSYTRTNFDYLIEQDFDGILSIRKRINYDNNVDRKSIKGTISKGFENYIKKVMLQVSYSLNTSNQLQQGNPVEYQNNLLISSFTLEASPASWVNAFYVFNYSNSKSKLSVNSFNHGSINRFDHRLKINLFPIKNWQLGVNMEYENSSAQTNLPDVFFIDANISYKLKKLEFILNWNNISNQRDYVIATYGDFYFSKNTYELRPRNLLLTVRLSL